MRINRKKRRKRKKSLLVKVCVSSGWQCTRVMYAARGSVGPLIRAISFRCVHVSKLRYLNNAKRRPSGGDKAIHIVKNGTYVCIDLLICPTLTISCTGSTTSITSKAKAVLKHCFVRHNRIKQEKEGPRIAPS